MKSSAMQDALLSALGQQALLLTANRRLARHWRLAYDAAQQSAGARAWPAPAVRAWPDWVTDSIDALLPDRLTPSPFAERRGWAKVIDAGPLLDAEATAQSASQAWALCQQYQVPLTHPAFLDAEDTARFRQWALAFETRAEKNHWLPAARREQWLAAHLPLTIREVWLDGFDEITPAQRALLAKLNHRVFQGAAQPAVDITRAHYPDALAEIEAAANWARTLLENGRARSIGIVVQDLAGLRPDVEAVFEDILGTPLFNISLGRPIADWPIASTALQLLRLLARPLDIATAGALLRSPFLPGAAAERNARAQLDLQLRNDNVLELSAARLRASAPPILAASLGAAITRLAALPARQSPGAWARAIPGLLTAAGWPGDRTQSSPERQALAHSQLLLRELAALDVVDGPMPLSEAVSVLAALAAESIFQPESPEMPVQILEALQAAGSRFDALWAMGMTDTVWPAPARPNPFIPRALQRELDLPHSTPERELRFAREVTARLLHSAPAVIFSHPERKGDEELRPSRIIESYPAGQPEMKRFPGFAIAAKLDESADTSAPKPLPGEKLRGGTSILAWQSQCPFRAFATVRLRASEWPEPEPGLSPLERGSALHEALAALWNRFRTRSALAALSEADRQSAIAAAVAAGCATLATTGRERLVELEAIRLHAVLEDWIELDFSRDEFTVEHTEHPIDLAAAGPPLQGFADRIDRLPSGQLVLIDYKSSAPGKRVWAGERPDNLQLPLYAIALPETPAAIAFAQLKRGEHKFDGLASSKEILPRVRPPEQGWDAQLAEWRQTIAKIWTEFTEARADVDPKDGGKPCHNCHLHSLCRVYDSGLQPAGDDELS